MSMPVPCRERCSGVLGRTWPVNNSYYAMNTPASSVDFSFRARKEPEQTSKGMPVLLVVILILTAAPEGTTLSDFIWSDIKWALEALAPILMSARIKSDHFKSAHSKVRQNFLVEKYF